ncbi:MAG: BrnA antitoxin family protein [Candidatus Devosia phytovorans]|uniref:BrnA antitoxin family protein n=1 Tax=Candidatus Devosia phytovorans TaxID=3121372 RepID=A0AAJ5VSB3_9HYPH|nr:BrnA antitoxin family protein [Devosia sp.]WEK03913.1 MAG: BrnA antitoxin family protein [Devosia sp.]
MDDFEKRVGDDIPEATAEDFARARPITDFPELLEALDNGRARGQRGPQKSEVKDRIGLRLDHHIVEHFRATGPGWQSRINDVLDDYVKKNS